MEEVEREEDRRNLFIFKIFCLVCISQSAECLTQENHFSIACELCNTITTTPSLSLLPSNSIAQKLLSTFKQTNKQQLLVNIVSSSQRNCDNEECKEENKKASLYCEICDANYCEICWKKFHSIGTLKKHSPLPLHQKNNTKYCSTHLQEQIEFYCVPCDQLLCSLCLLDSHQNLLNNLNIIKKEHLVISMDKANEKMKEEFIASTDLILSNRKIIDDRLRENKKKIEEIETRISSLHHEIEKLENDKKKKEIIQMIDEKKNNIEKLLKEIAKQDIEKLEIEKEIMTNKIKEDEEISTQIEISNKMIKDMIQSPLYLTTQKKYRDQIDHQISRVFESLYSFPLLQTTTIIIEEHNIDEICILNEQSFVGDKNSFTLSNDGKKLIKKQIDYCGITVKKGISSGKYQWKILYDPIDNTGWFLIGVQLNKPICSSSFSYTEKETFGIHITSINYGSSGYY